MIDATVINPSTWTENFVLSWTEVITQANFGTAPANLPDALNAAGNQLSGLTDNSGPQQVILNDDGTATVIDLGV